MSTAIDKLINTAKQEIGYLEKTSNSQLDDKTANAGSNNYTKYARDIYPALQAQAWCDMFVDWCFVQAFGNGPAKQLICGGFSAYTPDSAQYYKNKGRYIKSGPQPGDQIFFRNSERIYHTGIVINVDSKRVYTIEGNTSNGTAVIANGGAVCQKSYLLTDAAIDGYGRPDYSIVELPEYTIGWTHDDNGWYYADTKTTYYKSCWKVINNHKYYFNPDGYAVTNWQTLPHPETGVIYDFYFEPRAKHPFECALYITDKYGAQIIGTF